MSNTAWNKVKDIRMEKGLSVQQLALLSQLSNSTVSDIENGKEMPNHLTMLRLCKSFDMKMQHVFESDYKNVKL